MGASRHLPAAATGQHQHPLVLLSRPEERGNATSGRSSRRGSRNRPRALARSHVPGGCGVLRGLRYPVTHRRFRHGRLIHHVGSHPACAHDLDGVGVAVLLNREVVGRRVRASVRVTPGKLDAPRLLQEAGDINSAVGTPETPRPLRIPPLRVQFPAGDVGEHGEPSERASAEVRRESTAQVVGGFLDHPSGVFVHDVQDAEVVVLVFVVLRASQLRVPLFVHPAVPTEAGHAAHRDAVRFLGLLHGRGGGRLLTRSGGGPVGVEADRRQAGLLSAAVAQPLGHLVTHIDRPCLQGLVRAAVEGDVAGFVEPPVESRRSPAGPGRSTRPCGSSLAVVRSMTGRPSRPGVVWEGMGMSGSLPESKDPG